MSRSCLELLESICWLGGTSDWRINLPGLYDFVLVRGVREMLKACYLYVLSVALVAYHDSKPLHPFLNLLRDFKCRRL